MADSPSSRTTKVIDFQNGEVIQVGDNNNTNKIFHNCIININNYYNQPPPQTADADQTTEPYLRQVHVQVQKKAKKNGRPATAPGDGMVVKVDMNTRKVVKVPLDAEEPFRKCELLSYREHNGTAVKRVQRATRRVGQVFDGHDFDFAWWCYTGQNESCMFASYLERMLAFYD